MRRAYRWSSYAGEAAAGRPLDEKAIAVAISDEAVLLAPGPGGRTTFEARVATTAR